MRISIIIIHLVLCHTLCGQTQLQFAGLKRTKLDYLAARVDGIESNKQGKKQGLWFDGELANDASRDRLRQSLVNLPAIRHAEWQWQKTMDGDSSLLWTIEESQTLFPLINFGGIKGNFHFLLGFNNIHFRGLGQELLAYYQNIDGEHNYQLTLRNQAIGGSRWGYLLESRRYAAIEPVYFSEGAVDYRYSNLGFSTGISYAPKARQWISFTFNAFREGYKKQNPNQLDGIGPDNVTLDKLALKTGYRINHIDYHLEKQQGWWLDNNAQIVNNLADNSRFLIWLGDFRIYQLLGKAGNLATRLRLGLSSNDKTPFAPFVLDSQVNIRGSGNRIDRGTAQVVINLEYRHTLWTHPSNWFCVQAVGFSDFGTWRTPGGSLGEITSSDNFRHFAGGGFRIISHAAQNAAIRLDYGIDLYNSNERGFVLGFGQYF